MPCPQSIHAHRWASTEFSINQKVIIAFVANLAIEQNEFDHFFHVLDEQHSLDIEKFKLQLGDELYGEYGAITSKEED